MVKKYTFHVSGTHCASCKILIEDIVKDEDFVGSVQVDLKKEIVDIETSSERAAEEIAAVLTEKIKPHGYELSVEKRPGRKKGTMLSGKPCR